MSGFILQSLLFFSFFRTKQEEMSIKRNSINHTLTMFEQNHTVPLFPDRDANKLTNETTSFEMDDFNNTISDLLSVDNSSSDNAVSNFISLLFFATNNNYFLAFLFYIDMDY